MPTFIRLVMVKLPVVAVSKTSSFAVVMPVVPKTVPTVKPVASTNWISPSLFAAIVVTALAALVSV